MPANQPHQPTRASRARLSSRVDSGTNLGGGVYVLRVVFREIKPGKEQQLRAWLAELNRRADEVRATFKDETVRAEQSFIVAGSKGPMLVGVADVDDPEQGAAAFAASRHPIDAQHRAVMQECLGPKLDIQPLYDVSAS